jgi:hypothetical protein
MYFMAQKWTPGHKIEVMWHKKDLPVDKKCQLAWANSGMYFMAQNLTPGHKIEVCDTPEGPFQFHCHHFKRQYGAPGHILWIWPLLLNITKNEKESWQEISHPSSVHIEIVRNSTFFIIGNLHMHLMSLETTTSTSNLFL